MLVSRMPNRIWRKKFRVEVLIRWKKKASKCGNRRCHALKSVRFPKTTKQRSIQQFIELYSVRPFLVTLMVSILRSVLTVQLWPSLLIWKACTQTCRFGTFIGHSFLGYCFRMRKDLAILLKAFCWSIDKAVTCRSGHLPMDLQDAW